MDSTTSIPDQPDRYYDYYPLNVGRGNRLVPDDHEVVLNTRSGHAMLIDWEKQRVQAETTFTDMELPLMRTLLDDWPSYVPYEKLIRLLIPDSILAEQFIQCINIAREMNNTAMLNVALEPLRDVLRGCTSERLHLLSIDIVAVYQHGYRLVPFSTKDEPLL